MNIQLVRTTRFITRTKTTKFEVNGESQKRLGIISWRSGTRATRRKNARSWSSGTPKRRSGQSGGPSVGRTGRSDGQPRKRQRRSCTCATPGPPTTPGGRRWRTISPTTPTPPTSTGTSARTKIFSFIV